MSEAVRAELAALERADQLEQAAELAEAHGLFADAARLWERACHFDRAARTALQADRFSDALLLSARARDAAVLDESVRALSAQPLAAQQAARRAALAGHRAAAAMVYLAIGDASAAAFEFEQSELWLEAARAHERAGDPRAAARCFEREIERNPPGSAARLRLAELLAVSQRPDRALMVLQEIPADAEEHLRALPLKHELLVALDLRSAASDVERELARHGLTPTPPRSSAARAGAEPELLFGRYRMEHLVATTPNARVYKAFDVIDAEHVAVKLFAGAALEVGRDALSRFEREARALGQLRHPAIVPLRAYLPAGPAVVLRWMEGGSLGDLLEREAPSPARAVEIVSAVLSALAEAHRRGILHRDVKPANVLFDATGAAHLADFGTAHVSDAAATVTAGVIGTLAYMAPEQRAGAPATIASDVYGAGALLWHTLTGAPPAEQLPFLSEELDRTHRAAAGRLIAPEDERPGDALSARALLTTLVWPRNAPPKRARPVGPEAGVSRGSARIAPSAAGRHYDALLEREIHVLSADPATLARALPFARANHPLLPAVLAYRKDSGKLWIEYVRGSPLERSLTPEEQRALERALTALHAAGGCHGSVDRQHVVSRGGSVLLRFPLLARSCTLEADLTALEQL
jgi:eukaryotic-like serine/threonine-protein kinase